MPFTTILDHLVVATFLGHLVCVYIPLWVGVWLMAMVSATAGLETASFA